MVVAAATKILKDLHENKQIEGRPAGANFQTKRSAREYSIELISVQESR